MSPRGSWPICSRYKALILIKMRSSGWESGKRFITDIELKALAKVLNVTYAELLD